MAERFQSVKYSSTTIFQLLKQVCGFSDLLGFILFLFPDYGMQIINISLYLNRYSEINPWERRSFV